MNETDRTSEVAGPIALNELQRDLILGLVGEFRAVADDERAREMWSHFRDEIARMEVGGESADLLGRILEAALTSGRVVRKLGRAAELSLVTLYRRTPQARHTESLLAAFNSALAELKGQRVERISASLRAPSVYALTIATDGCRLVARIGPEGAAVESVEVLVG
jgi:hypothetical protein